MGDNRDVLTRSNERSQLMEAIAAISFYFGVVGLIGAGLYQLDMWMDTDKARHTDAKHRA